MKSNKNINKWLLVALGVLAFVGFLDAMYLTLMHYSDNTVACIITTGCETVANSIYSAIFGIPVALLGVLWYSTAIGLMTAYYDTGKAFFLKFFAGFGTIAAMSSAFFIYAQIVLLKSICFWCMISAGISFTLFFAGIYFVVRLAKNEK